MIVRPVELRLERQISSVWEGRLTAWQVRHVTELAYRRDLALAFARSGAWGPLHVLVTGRYKDQRLSVLAARWRL